MKVAAVVRDLMLYSRIESAAASAHADLVRVDEPRSVPPDVELVFVDWSARETSWSEPLRALRDAGVRVVLFGPHVDLDAHAAARDAGLGPMMARSKLITQLPQLL
ncbi:MAG: hypothetical protein KY392_02020 [Chloroflexi bacterium]|nr:hypothetical protein [Chloroflexota bacterium]